MSEKSKREILITKPTKYIRDIFAHMFGGIGGMELIIFSIIFVITAGLVVLIFFLTKGESIYLQIGLCAGVLILGILILFFLIRTKANKDKEWKYLHDKYRYEFDNNKKELDSPDIFNLFNIECIHDNGDIEFNVKSPNKGGLKSVNDNHSFNKDNMHGVLFKLSGVNVGLLTNDESNRVIDAMANPWLKIDLNHKIIIVDEEINIKPMNDYLYGLKEKYKNVTNIKIDGPTDADIKLNQINNYININDEIKQKNIVNKGIYILFFYYKESDLDNACAEIEGVGNSTKTSLTRVENKQTVCNILNTLYVPLSDKWFNGKSKIGINQNLGKIKIFKDYIQLGKKQFTKLIEIKQCPTLVTAGWLRKISTYRNIQTFITFEKTDAEVIRQNLERSKRKIKLNWEFVKSEGEAFNQKEYVDVMTNLIHDYAKGYSRPWYVNITFIITASSKDELLDLTKSFTKELKSVDRFQFNELNYFQHDALMLMWSFQYTKKKKLMTYMELSNDAVGAMYPFVSNALKDTQGVQLGYETYSGDPFWFDLKMKEGKLRNSNVCLVCAKTGGGKTYTVNKICNWFKNTSFNKNMRQYIVDPLGDYYGLFVNHYNVSKIDMTDASKGLINPLQILDEEKDRTTHANEFIVWLSMIGQKKFSAKIEKLLIENILELYEKFHISDDFNEIKDDIGETHHIYKYSKLDNKKWPTTDDLYEYLLKKFKNVKSESQEEEMIHIVWKVSEQGNYGRTWNGYTTLNVEHADIVILDTHSLDPDRDPILFKCQMYLISSFLRGEALKNRDRNLGITNVDDLRWITIVVDEAHRWVKNNPIALKTLELLAREIRHHKGVLILSTQNIADFKGEPEAILKQALYQIVLNMTPADVTSYDELLKEAGGLTQNEKDYIINASIGEALISIGPKYRCYVKIKANQIEEYMWINGAK